MLSKIYKPFIPINYNTLKILQNKYGTPFQLYDEKLIRNNIKKLKAAFDKNFNGFNNYFAVKALPNPSILNIMLDEECGLDCSSVSELYIADKLNCKEIIYTSNFTSKEDLKYALDKNILINLDDISHIQTILNLNFKMPESISFRYNPSVGLTNSETKSNILAGNNSKFGIDQNQIIECYELAKKYGTNKFGIHMMTGSCVNDKEYWLNNFEDLLKLIIKIKNRVNIDFEFINIGGGLGIPYKEGEFILDIHELSDDLFKITNKYNLNQKFPKLYMENGRFITGPFGWLVSECKSIKKRLDNNHELCEKYYGLDSCMANLMRPGMYNAYHHISIPKYNNCDLFKSNVVGSLCENNDWFCKNRLLPNAEIGDLFVIHDTGAHSHSMGFQYNGKLRAPEILYTINNEFNLIRERETIKDLYKNTYS